MDYYERKAKRNAEMLPFVVVCVVVIAVTLVGAFVVQLMEAFLWFI